MKQYKVDYVIGIAVLEESMNNTAKDGWRVVAVTVDDSLHYTVTYEKDLDN